MVLTETQLAIRDMVRDFARERLRPHVRACEAAGAYPQDPFTELASLGLMGMVADAEAIIAGRLAGFVA